MVLIQKTYGQMSNSNHIFPTFDSNKINIAVMLIKVIKKVTR